MMDNKFNKSRKSRKSGNVKKVCIVSRFFILNINNEPEMSFTLKDEMFEYVKRFRSQNQVFRLNMYKIEISKL